MALCTICLADPCPHLMMRGGTAGAPLVPVGVKAVYAPSVKPTCPQCDRHHRNIGVDARTVCAWRTYSRAKGSDFEPMTPDAVDEFARWFRSGAWAAPSRKTKAAAAPPAPSSSVAAPASVAPAPAPTAITVPVIEDDEPVVLKEEDTVTTLEREAAAEAHAVEAAEAARKAALADMLAAAPELSTPPSKPKKVPSFSKGKTIKDEKRQEVPA